MQDWRSRGDFQIFQYLVMKWLSCFLIGLIMGLVGFFNNLAVENIAGKKFVITSNMMLEGRYSLHFSSSFVLLLIEIFAIFSICLVEFGSSRNMIDVTRNNVLKAIEA